MNQRRPTPFPYHHPKIPLPVSRTFRGMTTDGRYIHITKNGRITYHSAYYTIDGRLLQPHFL